MNIKELFFLLVLAVFIVIPSNTQAQRNTQPPNIIFILTDDLGYGDLGVFYQNLRKKEGKKRVEYTPNLDKMAEQGAKLTHYYCAAPVCAPSRASILTGLSQGHANIRDNQFDKALADNHTIATVLKKAGYSTAAIGKWGLQGKGKDVTPPDWPAHPLNRGFDYFLGYIRHRDGHEHYPKEGIYRGTKEVWENHTNLTPKLDKCYTADLWTAAAKKFIIDQSKGENTNKPFFIYLAYDTPHAVLELPTQAYPEGGGLNGGLQWTGEPGHMINTASGKVDSWTYPDYADAKWDNDKSPSTPDVPWPEVYQRYATATHRIDDAVGDIFQLLKDLNIDENTFVVFTSDNGPSRESYLPKKYQPNIPTFFRSFGPFDGIKRDCWEGGVRMPTLVSWPGHIPEGKTVENPVASHDWLATFANVAGVPAPANSDGVSLIPALTGKGKQRESLVYVEYFQGGKTPDYTDFIPRHRGRKRNQMQTIRLGDYVGVRYDIQSHNDDFEIYDILKDPQEINNLAGKPEMASLQEEMKNKVLWSRRPDADAPRPYDHELLPAVQVEKTTPGVKWRAFKGEYPWVPCVHFLPLAKNGYTPVPDANAWKKMKDGALFFSGYLDIPEDGEYTFTIIANEGTLFRIHNATIIDADYGYKPGTTRKGKVLLKKGLHPFRIHYLSDGKKDKNLKFLWSGPGFSEEHIPASVFYH
jgi:arylsulfatase A-like enzyme